MMIDCIKVDFNDLEDLLESLMCSKKSKVEDKTEKQGVKTVSKTELKEMFREEIKKQVNEETSKYRDVLKELVDRVCVLEDNDDRTDEAIDDLTSTVKNLKKRFESECCKYDVHCIDCPEDEEDGDYSCEEDISNYVEDLYGLTSETISDGEYPAIIIPLEDEFDLKKFCVQYLLNN